MNFSTINFSPNSFISMHQFNPATKIVGSIQQNIAFVPATTAQNYQSNQVSFPNNVQTTSTAVGIQNQHHYQEAASTRLVNHNGIIRQVNSTSTASTAAQTSWTDSSNCLPNDTSIKSNLPVLSQQSQGNQMTQTVQRLPRTVVMQSVSTMTDFESSRNESKVVLKGSINSEYNNENIKHLNDVNSFKSPVCNNSCSMVNLKSSASAMAEYLSRLKQSQIPPDIEEFLKEHKIKINISYTEPINSNKDYEDSSRSDSEAVLRLSTALDGSLLYCCSECQIAYAHKEQLDSHLSVHQVERKFECNVCGICLKRKEHLDQHKRGHSEERPFVCEICCKGFKRNEHLRRHVVIHSGDKNHVCTQCGKAFSRKDHLTKHIQIHVIKQGKNEANDSISPSHPVQTHNSLKNSEQTLSS